MAIKTLEEKKKQQKLMIVLGILVLATFLVLYFGVLNKGAGVEVTNVTQPVTEEGIQSIDSGQITTKTATSKQPSALLLEERLKKIDLNTDFLVNNILPTLRVYGAIPVEKGVTGRPNPFVAQ